jgi:hypothetical protein
MPRSFPINLTGDLTPEAHEASLRVFSMLVSYVQETNPDLFEKELLAFLRRMAMTTSTIPQEFGREFGCTLNITPDSILVRTGSFERDGDDCPSKEIKQLWKEHIQPWVVYSDENKDAAKYGIRLLHLEEEVPTWFAVEVVSRNDGCASKILYTGVFTIQQTTLGSTD